MTVLLIRNVKQYGRRVAATSTRRDGGDRGGRLALQAVHVSLSVCPFVRPSQMKFDTYQRHGKITYLGAETPEPITTKFCMPGAIQDVITHANFCENRLRGFGVGS